MPVEDSSKPAELHRRLRLGMVGGGRGAFIGAVHRIAARLDDQYELVAGALTSEPATAIASATDLHIDSSRAYPDFRTMAAAEGKRGDRIDVVAIVAPNHVHAPAALAFLEAGIHVICDKPMTRTLAEAHELAKSVKHHGKVFALTHNYTGYPLVRHARAMVASGELGTIRVVQVEYAQDWLTTSLETAGQKQALWRTDPTQSGAGGCLGDIGTHAFNLAEFVSGLNVQEIAAELSTFVPGRRLDDNAQMMLRFSGGARGALWSTQVAPGNENALQLRIYGERAGLLWRQETPNELHFAEHGRPPTVITRGGHGSGAIAAHATRIPSGHPEGYLEAFAQLYADAADLIRASDAGTEPPEHAMLVPTVTDGVRGMRFIEAAVSSSRHNAGWVSL